MTIRTWIDLLVLFGLGHMAVRELNGGDRSTRQDLIDSIKVHQTAFRLSVEHSAMKRLADFYAIILEHNPLLHLVAPVSTTEFAVRHLLESLTLLEFLPIGAQFADIGAGAGLPSLPCLLVRDDLRATLIESKLKKAAFLEEAVNRLDLRKRAAVIARQFEEVEPAAFEYVTCRALDKFTAKLPKLLKWSGRRRLLLFGGPSLRNAVPQEYKIVEEKLMPASEQRYLYILDRRARLPN